MLLKRRIYRINRPKSKSLFRRIINVKEKITCREQNIKKRKEFFK